MKNNLEHQINALKNQINALKDQIDALYNQIDAVNEKIEYQKQEENHLILFDHITKIENVLMEQNLMKEK